jgi:hypothetical protein
MTKFRIVDNNMFVILIILSTSITFSPLIMCIILTTIDSVMKFLILNSYNYHNIFVTFIKLFVKWLHSTC